MIVGVGALPNEYPMLWMSLMAKGCSRWLSTIGTRCIKNDNPINHMSFNFLSPVPKARRPKISEKKKKDFWNFSLFQSVNEEGEDEDDDDVTASRFIESKKKQFS